MQAPHVAADARDSEEAGTVIDQLFEVDGIVLLLAHQIDQDAGIEITAARAHNHAAGRGQSHAGVDRFAALDRSDAGAIAEMSDDQTVGQAAAELAKDRFAGKAVKPVALDAGRLQFLGDRQNPRDLGQLGVKRGVEAGGLRQLGEVLPCHVDHRQRRRDMQRSESSRGVELPEHGIVDQAMAAKPGSAMHEAMSDGGGGGHIGIGQESADADDRRSLAGNGYRLREQCRSARISYAEVAFLVADRLGLARKQHFEP
jgi:hypothetical protein